MFWNYASQFGPIDRVSQHLNTLGPILKISYICKRAQSAILQNSRIFKVLIFPNKWVDFIGLGIMILNLVQLDEFNSI